MIQRQEYLERLISYREQQIIKVVTGVRRCGKSTLFQLYIEHLKATGVEDDQIISINLEDLDFEELLNYKALYSYIKERLHPTKYTYVFIDEVQNCDGFEKAVDSLFIKDKVDVYITGSNAYMLSGELSTLLSGRYISLPMLPLSFGEYWNATKTEDATKAEIFNRYLRFGGFPYVASLQQSDEMVMPYLEGIYNTIVLKDVAQRAGTTDITLLESIVKTLLSSVGCPVSAKKISDTLTSAGRKNSSNTVERYLRALCDSYLFYKVDRYDIKGRQHLKTLGKYYMVDSGLRTLLLANTSPDLGHVIENVVYLELQRRGWRISTGKQAEKEIDFVATKTDKVEYYQVSASVLDDKTLERELAPLQALRDNYPKYLLTLDEVGTKQNHEGIQQLNLIEWLLDME